ncbi:hypothetical protein OXV69_16880 [Bacteroides fragilis]|nr:hypothetical protein [Bacteroides fragilis]
MPDYGNTWKDYFLSIKLSLISSSDVVGVNTLCVGVVAAGFEYWILFAVLIFLGISTFSYLLAHYFWNSSYWGMFLKNAGMFLLALFVTYLRMMFYDL